MNLEELLENDKNFYSKYFALKQHLKENVYNELQFRQFVSDDNKILLNDHGIEHVETVIKRASDLTNSNKINLSMYEIFILLVAILIHDIGVVYGRKEHELKSQQIYKSLFTIVNYDVIEAKQVLKIAECHTGEIKESGDKDKIYYLQEKETLKHGVIRNRLIAALLKFADELADDESRSFKQMLINNKIPSNSEIYHAYSFCLYPPEILHESKTIKLTYNIPYEFLDRVYGDTKKFLLDLIYEKLIKMHLERIYCMRYLRPLIELDRISGEIKFYSSQKPFDDVPELGKFIHNRITFELIERGYPEFYLSKGIHELCPDTFIDKFNKKLTGLHMQDLIKNKKGE